MSSFALFSCFFALVAPLFSLFDCFDFNRCPICFHWTANSQWVRKGSFIFRLRVLLLFHQMSIHFFDQPDHPFYSLSSFYSISWFLFWRQTLFLSADYLPPPPRFLSRLPNLFSVFCFCRNYQNLQFRSNSNGKKRRSATTGIFWTDFPQGRLFT